MGTTEFYNGAVTNGDQKAMIFISRATLPALVDADQLFMDSKFKTVPVLFMQLFTVYASSLGEV